MKRQQQDIRKTKLCVSPVHTGFTLIEVMVSLVILAIALTALMYSNAESIRNVQYLKNKTAAHWVAMNVMSEVKLGLVGPTSADKIKNGEMEMLGAQWDWSINTAVTPDKHTLRVTIDVSKSMDNNEYASVDGYIWNPHDETR